MVNNGNNGKLQGKAIPIAIVLENSSDFIQQRLIDWIECKWREKATLTFLQPSETEEQIC